MSTLEMLKGLHLVDFWLLSYYLEHTGDEHWSDLASWEFCHGPQQTLELLLTAGIWFSFNQVIVAAPLPSLHPVPFLETDVISWMQLQIVEYCIEDHLKALSRS